MKRFFICGAFIILGVTLYFLAKNNQDDFITFADNFIYTGGGKDIQYVDMEDKKSVVIYKSPYNVAMVEHLTKVNDETIIFDEHPITKSRVLRRLNIRNRNEWTLRSGQMPTYIPQSNKIFFYDRSASDGEKWLFVADMQTINTPSKIMKAPPPRILKNGLKSSLTHPVIQISPDEVVFVGEDRELWLYNISTSKLLSTGISHCIPQVWRSRTEQLIYCDWGFENFYQIDLKTKHRIKLPILKEAYGLVYAPDRDMLIYGKTRLYMFISETFDVFVYRFSDGKENKILSNVSINSGIWIK